MHLILNNRPYTSDDLLKGVWIQAKTEFEITTLTFCHQWLSGQSSFELATSGSTGSPKKMSLSRAQMEASALLTLDVFKLPAGSTFLVCLNTKYIAGIMMLVRGIMGNMNLIAVEPQANPLRHISNDLQIDFAAFVPYQMDNILESPDHNKINNIKHILLGGAPVSVVLNERIKKLKSNIYETYGMTETLTHIAMRQLNNSASSEYFLTLPGITVGIDSDSCLVIQASHLDAKRIITNDVVELVSHTQFRWLGRRDNIINSGGIKIVPEKLEEVVGKVFAARKISNRFFIGAIPNEKLWQELVLFVEGFPFIFSPESLLQEIGKYISVYERPKAIKFINRFAETPSGKLKRRESMSNQTS